MTINPNELHSYVHTEGDILPRCAICGQPIWRPVHWVNVASEQVEGLARELYGVMKEYSDSVETDDDPNFVSFEQEDDDFKGLMRALALHVIQKGK